MPNALISSLAILEDIDNDPALNNVDTDWLYLQPTTLLWANKIFVPRIYAQTGQQFRIDVGFEKSNEAISEATSNVWNRLVTAGIIQAAPIGKRERELASWAFNTIKNRVDQTERGEVGDGLFARVQRAWKSPPEFLTIENHEFCPNHLDAVAANVMLAQCTNSIWLSNPREDSAARWFLSGGFNPQVKKQPAAKAVIGKVNELLLPQFQIIPPVAACANCGANGGHCYSDSYGPKDWVAGAKPRLERMLEWRETDEAIAMRKTLDEIISRVIAAGNSGHFDFENEARHELVSAMRKARARMEKDLKKVEKYCGLVALFSLVPQWVSETARIKEMSLLSLSLSTAATVGIETYRNFVCSRNSWINIKENVVDDDAIALTKQV
jgi:hypothetical protein